MHEGLFCKSRLELALIRQITREDANLALTELAATLCELHKRMAAWLPAPQPRLRRQD